MGWVPSHYLSSDVGCLSGTMVLSKSLGRSRENSIDLQLFLVMHIHLDSFATSLDVGHTKQCH